MNKYDLVVIGWGKAGKTLAKKAASAGMKVAMIEQDPAMYGGTCINVGCLPTKAMNYSSAALTDAKALGLAQTRADLESAYQHALTHRRNVVQKLNQKNHQLLAAEENVTIYLGRGRFVDAQTIEVTAPDSSTQQLHGEHIVINTGATPRLLPIPGADSVSGIYTSETVDSISQLPQRLLIVGAGFIGLEQASTFATFGSKVDVIQFDESFLPSEDRTDADAIKEALQRQGISFHFSTTVRQFRAGEDAIIADLEGINGNYSATYDAVIIAVGRVPATAHLNLEAAGIEMSPTGAVKVDEYLRTSAPGVWAAGDVTGGAQFTFISLDDYRVLAPQILPSVDGNNYHTGQRQPWATCTFINPPYARVGMNEREATEKGIGYNVFRLPAAAVPKAHVIGHPEGFLKVLVGTDGLLLGATLFHHEAHELINLLTLAMVAQVPAAKLRDFIYTHPTFSEALNDLFAALK